MPIASRTDDERTLDWLRRLCRGQSTAQVAAAWGVPQGTIRTAEARVKAADLAESGEPEAQVAAGYR